MNELQLLRWQLVDLLRYAMWDKAAPPWQVYQDDYNEEEHQMSKGKLIIRPLPEPDLWCRESEPWTRKEKVGVLLVVVLPIVWGLLFLAAACLWAVLQ